MRPCQTFSIKITMQNEYLSLPLQCLPRLNQTPRRFSGFDHNGRLRGRRHRFVPLRKEQAVSQIVLSLILLDQHLTDQQIVSSDLALKRSIDPWVDVSQRVPITRQAFQRDACGRRPVYVADVGEAIWPGRNVTGTSARIEGLRRPERWRGVARVIEPALLNVCGSHNHGPVRPVVREDRHSPRRRLHRVGEKRSAASGVKYFVCLRCNWATDYCDATVSSCIAASH